ncbi:helix-turn-helix transcriptional regulator [Modestobacter sp. SYSU DS0290]
MKAARLLTLLLLLQARQRMTTRELAERLDVSRRTVLRDVEALSAAGVPVYAERGRHGGVVLLTGARLNASHLDPGEIEALSLTGVDHARLQQLGLAAAAEQAAHKLAARRARMPGAGVTPWSELIIADSTAWLASPADVDIADLATDLRARQRLEIRYRRSGTTQPAPVVVDPYGLAVKAGRWYLVADTDGAPRVFALERLTSYEVLRPPARLRAGHTLTTVWAHLRAQVEQAGDVAITARLRRSRLDLARRILGSRMGDVRHLDELWCQVTVRYEEVEGVRQLLQFGDHIEVLAPEPARQLVHQLARDLATRHGPTASG